MHFIIIKIIIIGIVTINNTFILLTKIIECFYLLIIILYINAEILNRFRQSWTNELIF